MSSTLGEELRSNISQYEKTRQDRAKVKFERYKPRMVSASKRGLKWITIYESFDQATIKYFENQGIRYNKDKNTNDYTLRWG